MSNLVELRRAFEEKRLAAVHVDLQTKFFDKYTSHAFPIVNQFASDMRVGNVPNYWVAYTSQWHVGLFQDFLKANHSAFYSFHECVRPMSDELVFEKREEGAFETKNAPLLTHLQKQRQDTVLITGVLSYACVASTVYGALDHNLSIYLIADATDRDTGTNAEWEDTIINRWANGVRERRSKDERLRKTTSWDDLVSRDELNQKRKILSIINANVAITALGIR